MKSFILSFSLTAIICVFFMSVFEPKMNAHYKNVPNWIFWIIVVAFFAGYILAFYWGIINIFRQERLFNLLGICFSVLGLGLYIMFFMMENGKGKASKNQFEHDITKIESSQLAALNNLLQQTGTQAGDIKFINYWDMSNDPGDFALCVQKGNIMALMIKNKPINDVGCISVCKKLDWLVLQNCHLETIEKLDIAGLRQLDISRNKLSSLKGLEHAPNISLLNFSSNPVTDTSALTSLTNKYLSIVRE